MKHFLGLCIFASLTACGNPAHEGGELPSTYDPVLAERLGGDERGMAQYVFVTLKTGPNDAEITDEATRNELFAGHFANMTKLAEDGKLVLAGPFIEAQSKRGLFILDVQSIDDARALVETDPALSAGIFVAEYDKYYGSAALRDVNDLHNRIQRTPVE